MRRILELDALRGISAVVIVLAHIGAVPGTPWALSMVDLFFVLSGYFITTSIVKNRQTPGFLSVFFTRRALRIWPAYYVALAACLLLNRVLKWDAPPDAWPQYLTFTQNVQAYLNRPLPSFSGMFIHAWTLAIEEQFYVLWPLLLWRAGRRALPAIVLAFAAFPPVARALGYSPYLLLTRCDGLALGSLLALVVFDRDRVARHLAAYRLGFAAVGLAALVVPALAGEGPARWLASLTGVPGARLVGALFTTRVAVVYFGLAGLTLCLQGHPALRPLRDRRLCYVGTISYGLYLYHPLVFAALPGLYRRWVVRKLGLTSTLLMDVVMIGVCFALAELSRRLLEGPVLALKERVSYRGARFEPEEYHVIDPPQKVGYRGPHSIEAAAVTPEAGSVSERPLPA
jgi:peptidoglycan/LPS O-acetylase OafA/YrhL